MAELKPLKIVIAGLGMDAQELADKIAVKRPIVSDIINNKTTRVAKEARKRLADEICAQVRDLVILPTPAPAEGKGA